MGTQKEIREAYLFYGIKHALLDDLPIHNILGYQDRRNRRELYIRPHSSIYSSCSPVFSNPMLTIYDYPVNSIHYEEVAATTSIISTLEKYGNYFRVEGKVSSEELLYYTLLDMDKHCNESLLKKILLLSFIDFDGPLDIYDECNMIELFPTLYTKIENGEYFSIFIESYVKSILSYIKFKNTIFKEDVGDEILETYLYPYDWSRTLEQRSKRVNGDINVLGLVGDLYLMASELRFEGYTSCTTLAYLKNFFFPKDSIADIVRCIYSWDNRETFTHKLVDSFITMYI